MFCTNCGKELEPGTKFCWNCGYNVNAPLEQVNTIPTGLPVKSDKKKKISTVIIGVALTLLIVIVVAVAVCVNDGYHSEDNGYNSDTGRLPSIKNMSGPELFKYICEIEQRCKGMTVESVTENSRKYCDGQVYRFIGTVTSVVDETVLLSLCPQDIYIDNTIVCNITEPVSLGEKICVYGTGSGTSTYTRTYNNTGITNEYETLYVNALYILREETIIATSLPDYIRDFVCGTFRTNNIWLDIIEEEVVFTGDRVNGRECTINELAITHGGEQKYSHEVNNLDLQVRMSSTSKRNKACTYVFHYDLWSGGDSFYLMGGEKGSMSFDSSNYVRIGYNNSSGYKGKDDTNLNDFPEGTDLKCDNLDYDPMQYQATYEDPDGRFYFEMLLLPNGADYNVVFYRPDCEYEHGVLTLGEPCTLSSGTVIQVERKTDQTVSFSSQTLDIYNLELEAQLIT